MKRINLFFIMLILVLFWIQIGSADRLHHWIDSKGVTHLSKEPPAEGGKLVEIMEYSARTDDPAQPDQLDAGRKPEKQNEQVIVEKVSETEARPKPKDDPATACYVYANMEEVTIYVTELNRPGGVQEKVLYQGTIPKDQKQLIQSSRGKIKFNYRRSAEDRTYGDNQADCVNGHVISIP